MGSHVPVRLARLARTALRVPTALVSFWAGDLQVHPGAVGLPEPWAGKRETPLTHSFCQHVVDEGGVQPGALDQGGEDDGGQVDGVHPGQAAAAGQEVLLAIM